ncbi:hypothetical protein UPYG_G00341670 [Umbra pygmaea]|uniref:Uncharacterized protein n=1 Tax=Umbra pygmaea TaxID=75934 RepID=A0ABD0W1F4_UMBPY
MISLVARQKYPLPHIPTPFSFCLLPEHRSDYLERNLPIMAPRFQVKVRLHPQTPWHSTHPWKPPWELSSGHSTSRLAVEMPRPTVT